TNADARGVDVVVLHGGDGMGMELDFDGRVSLHVWRRRSGMLSQSDEDFHDLAAEERARARAGVDVAERAMGRSVHAAVGGVGDEPCELAADVHDFRRAWCVVGDLVLPLVSR